MICLSASGQQADVKADENLAKAEVFHRSYQFGKAEEYYLEALKNVTDSTTRLDILDRIEQCRNGINMMRYIVRTEGITSGIFRTEDFYLYLDDLQDNSWINIPNPFIKDNTHSRNPYYTAMYFPKGKDRIIFSAPDESGAWNLYISSRKDSVTWSVPTLLSENVLSGKNEIFPILAPDGKTLYFASDGMPGMGGYDLFYSIWDEDAGDWSIPENMGFPYSSTSDDILFLNSNDGQYSIVVSNRETEADSVKIYVTEYIATPVRTVPGPDDHPLVLASFPATQSGTATGEGTEETGTEDDARTSEDRESYSSLMHELRRLQDEYDLKQERIRESRQIYGNASDKDKDFLESLIRDVEQEALDIKKKTDNIRKQVQEMEIDFLSRGIIPEEYVKDASELETPEAANVPEYHFTKHSRGRIPYMIVESPEPEFDYTFKILDRNKGQFVEDNTLPSGIVYQIQFAVLTDHAKTSEIRGMSPVFVTKMPSGKYLHTVGLFRNYDEALQSLNRVRKNGFKDAFIIAFNNGKSITTKAARSMEGKPQAAQQRQQPAGSGDVSYQVIIKGYGSTLPTTVRKVIEETCTKDITRSTNEEEILFAVGPFSKKADAEKLLEALQKAEIENVSIESIKL